MNNKTDLWDKAWRDSLVCIRMNTVPTPTPEKPAGWFKQEGNNPMRYETVAAPTAIASIAVPSDEQKKVEYLNDRVYRVYRDIELTFNGMFHMYKPEHPKYYKDLIDAIKNGEYEINEKEAKRADEAWAEHQEDPDDDWYTHSVFYGINFTKFPKADYAGREQAMKELRAEYQRVKDIIAIMSAEEALKAVQDFEKWQPSNAPTKQ